MRVLVTGGTGYIGSHTVVELVAAGHEVHIVDSLVNSSRVVLERVAQITGTEVPFTRADLRDEDAVEHVVAGGEFDAVVHFAGLKAVGESVARPLDYYDNNVGGTTTLCRVLQRHQIHTLIFSSSATVYGTPSSLPLTEDTVLGPIANPYGRTKLMIEQILTDLHQAEPRWRMVLLRYFNPVGAHPSGLIGEDPTGVPNNLMPMVAQVAVGKHQFLTVHGDDYDTMDGTGVRDYIHVVDLAAGHVAALDRAPPGMSVYNLGTGEGTSVLELVREFEEASGRTVPLEVGPRRPGDLAATWCDASKAARELGWRADRRLHEMCADAWRWQSANPHGYALADVSG